MCSFRTSLPEGEDNSNSDGGSLRKVIETDIIIVKVVTKLLLHVQDVHFFCWLPEPSRYFLILNRSIVSH